MTQYNVLTEKQAAVAKLILATYAIIGAGYDRKMTITNAYGVAFNKREGEWVLIPVDVVSAISLIDLEVHNNPKEAFEEAYRTVARYGYGSDFDDIAHEIVRNAKIIVAGEAKWCSDDYIRTVFKTGALLGFVTAIVVVGVGSALAKRR